MRYTEKVIKYKKERLYTIHKSYLLSAHLCTYTQLATSFYQFNLLEIIFMHTKSTEKSTYVLIYIYVSYTSSPMAQTVKNLPEMQETQVHPWVGKIPWKRKWQPTRVFLPGESHGRRSLVGCSPQGPKEWDSTERLNFSTFNLFAMGPPEQQLFFFHSYLHSP